MSYEFIDYRVKDGIGHVTLNRPDKLNSFVEEMALELQEVLKSAGEDDEVRCLLLAGHGRAFCAGQDLKEVMEKAEERENYPLGETVRKSYNPVIHGIRELEKPVVCMIHGTAAGAGANLALACDFVLASEEAKFIQSFSKIGLISDSGGTFMLPRLVGMARATALVMLGDPVTGKEAEAMGMIYKSCKAENLEEQTMNLALRLARMPTRGLGLTKRGINASFRSDLSSQLEMEAELQTEAGRTHDYNEGVQAFVEKRKPQFKGN